MLSKNQFPKDFLWGTATSAYQIEGAWNIDKSPSIWDVFCNEPNKIVLGASGKKACMHYDNFEKDLKIMKDMGVNAYRFSVAWTRIIDEDGEINQSGIQFYNRIINRLIEYEIEPVITMYHFDLPQYLQENGGWISRQTAEKFRDYALVLVDNFSDRVKKWVTINEPSVATYAGHLTGVHAPGWKNPEVVLKVAHNMLLAHGLAVKAIRNVSDVILGIALNLAPVFPRDPQSERDLEAAFTYDSYLYKFFLDGLFLKEYPDHINMKDIANFDDMEYVGEKLDFIGINYYTKLTVQYDGSTPFTKASIQEPDLSEYSDMWTFYPQGLGQVIKRCRSYNNCPDIYIMENGTSLPQEEYDEARIHYIQSHIRELKNCIDDNIPVKGYFIWSLLDNFEWAEGYSKKFGLVNVDFLTFKRRLKDSARWYTKFLKT